AQTEPSVAFCTFCTFAGTGGARVPEPLDPYDALLRERIVVLRSALDDAAAADVVAQLVMLERRDAAREVSLYINSPGGSFEAFSAVHDTVRELGPEVETVCFGRAEGT